VQDLRSIEARHNITILYACESGSRAWGFASQDSDWDVRFIYVRERDWYTSLWSDTKDDTITHTTQENIDIHGWDLKKALKLLYNSNCTVIEWLRSPIQYTIATEFSRQLHLLGHLCWEPVRGYHSYRGITHNTWKKYLEKGECSPKKYLYAIRPIICNLFILEHFNPPPVDFASLRKLVRVGYRIVRATDELLQWKIQGKGELHHLKDLHEYIRIMVDKGTTADVNSLPQPDNKQEKMRELDRYFHYVINQPRIPSLKE
jgi:uncharacterized protein